MRQVVTAMGFAKLIGKDPRTVSRWAQKGRIPARKIGRVWNIPIEEVEKAKTLLEYPPKDLWQR